MRIPVRLDLALIVLRIVLILGLMPFAIGWRTPFFASWRYVALAVLLALPLALIATEIWTLRRTWTRSRAARLLGGVSLALALLHRGRSAQYAPAVCRRSRRAGKTGATFAGGYRDAWTLQALIQRRPSASIDRAQCRGQDAGAIRQSTDALRRSTCQASTRLDRDRSRAVQPGVAPSPAWRRSPKSSCRIRSGGAAIVRQYGAPGPRTERLASSQLRPGIEPRHPIRRPLRIATRAIRRSCRCYRGRGLYARR